MKSKVISVLAVTALFAGCAGTPEFQTGPDAEVSHDGLTRIDRTIMDAVWARKDADISNVTGIRFVGLGVEYRNVNGPYSGRAGTSSSAARRGSSEFQLDESTRALFEEEIRSAFIAEFSRSTVFQVVEEPGPNILDVHIGLLDVVSRVPPDTVGRSRIFIDRVGEATVVLEVRDSISHTIIARAVDRRAAESSFAFESTPPRNRAEVRRLGRAWGQIIRDGLEKMIGDGLATAQ